MINIFRVNDKIKPFPDIDYQRDDNDHDDHTHLIVYLSYPLPAVVEAFVHIHAPEKGSKTVGEVKIGIAKEIYEMIGHTGFPVHKKSQRLDKTCDACEENHGLKCWFLSLSFSPRHEAAYEQEQQQKKSSQICYKYGLQIHPVCSPFLFAGYSL